MKNNWKFLDPANVAVITTKRIINGTASITFVSHDKEDGGWQFLEGGTAHAEIDAAVVSLKDIVTIDKSIGERADLPQGWTAKRGSALYQKMIETIRAAGFEFRFEYSPE